MSDWNSEQYLKFKKERTQPSTDLVNTIKLENPGRIIDIGCGPGNSTRALKINILRQKLSVRIFHRI